ncbi:RNA polymerase subunit sigma [uncultured Lacinutrix sp.]|uniref:RNA polymerase sigma factor n=1 Tax=uncultured Lacinutrix sp. TaxID=574032 RepID=UPI00262F318C|nr:RNA polymerase subunit sigma [uncultured Lacinutrix sp.]
MKNDDFVRQFLEGNTELLNNIYKNSFKYVSHYITSRDGSIKDAEDIFHNALLLIYVKLKEDSINIQSFDNYLFTVCKNLWKRENTKYRVTKTNIIPLVNEELDKAAFYLEHSQWELYKEKFELLSKQCKDILNMVFEKKPYTEIVSKYSYASQTVARQRVFKCKSRLAKLIKEDLRFSKLKLDK